MPNLPGERNYINIRGRPKFERFTLTLLEVGKIEHQSLEENQALQIGI